jgi:hypothetical protein
MKNLRRLWYGELALQNVFWDWAVFGGLIVNITCSGVSLLLVLEGHLILGFIVGYSISVPYNIIVLVGVWRSAERFPGERCWADRARIVTVVGMVLLSVT